MAVNSITQVTKDMWVADFNATVVHRQNTQDDSFSIGVYPGCSYLLFGFDEGDWTAATFNQKLSDYFEARNADDPPYKINRYQLIGLADTSRAVTFESGTDLLPDFYSNLGGAYRLSFNLKPNVTLPSLPKNILDLFEANQIQAKVSRHFQQPYKNYNVSLVDDIYATRYMALVIVNAVDDAGKYVVIDGDENCALADYFVVGEAVDADDATIPLFTSVQNLGHLVKDKNSMSVLADYYDVTLLGSNQMRLSVGNRKDKVNG